MATTLKIGTRASKLALAQANMVRDALIYAHPELEIEIVAMSTAGDREVHKKLSDWGYKGLFTKELEDGLLEGALDLCVHSMKDMPSELPSGLMIAALLPRADVRDAWVSPGFATIADLPHGATVGSSSARRIAQLLHTRPDVKITDLRGNVETRLRRIEEGVAVATFLASAGLQRLGLAHHVRSYLSTDEILPAVAQGAIGVECAVAREDVRAMLAAINHKPTEICITAERAMLRVLDGSCRTPIAGLAELNGARLHLRGEVLSLDGKIRHFHAMHGLVAEAEQLGIALGEELRARAGKELLTNG